MELFIRNFDMSLNKTNSNRSYYTGVLFIAVGSHLFNHTGKWSVNEVVTSRTTNLSLFSLFFTPWFLSSFILSQSQEKIKDFKGYMVFIYNFNFFLCCVVAAGSTVLICLLLTRFHMVLIMILSLFHLFLLSPIPIKNYILSDLV